MPLPMLPLMPSDSSGVASPSPGISMAPGPQQGPNPALASLLGAPPSPSIDPSSQLANAGALAMRQFDRLAQMILDLVRMFPGSEDPARQMMDGLERWRQQVVVTMAPSSSASPGAETMM